MPHKLSSDEFAQHLKKWCIALTGGIATGKSTVAAILRSKGFTVIDADQLARDVVKPGSPTLQAIKESFGERVIASSGELDRRALREIIARDDMLRKKLEELTHPAIQNQFQSKVENSGLLRESKTFFYEAALIFESHRAPLFRAVWATYCPEGIQIERLCQRSGLSKDEARLLISTQMPAKEKSLKADITINTDCSMNLLTSQVEDLLKTCLLARHAMN